MHPNFLSRTTLPPDAFAIYAMVLVGASQVTVAPAAGVVPAAAAAAGGGGGHFIAADALYGVSSRGVTVTAMAATQLAILLEHVKSVDHEPSKQHLGSLRTLRLVSCGGSSLAPALIQSLYAAAPGVTYFTDYGMTEACGRICTTLMLPSEEAIMRQMPEADRARVLARAGRAAPGVEVLVVRDGRPGGNNGDDSITSSSSSSGATASASATSSSSRLSSLSSRDSPPYVPVERDGKDIGEVLIRGNCVFEGYWDSAAQIPRIRSGQHSTSSSSLVREQKQHLQREEEEGPDRTRHTSTWRPSGKHRIALSIRRSRSDAVSPARPAAAAAVAVEGRRSGRFVVSLLP